MGFLSVTKAVGKVFVYTLTGDWSPHREAISRLRTQRERQRQWKSAIEADIRKHPAANPHDAFVKMCDRRGFDDDDIAYNITRYRYMAVFSAIFMVVLSVIFIALMLKSSGALSLLIVVTSKVYCFVGLLNAWFRYSQLRDRQLYTLKQWLMGG